MECDATAWLVDFPNPYSHRQLGRNPFAQHQNYPKIDSSTKDYPKTTLTFFAFCRTVRKCVKALSENYPTKWCTFFMTIRNAKITIRKFFRPATLARDNRGGSPVYDEQRTATIAQLAPLPCFFCGAVGMFCAPLPSLFPTIFACCVLVRYW